MEFDSKKMLKKAVEEYMEEHQIKTLDVTNIARKCGLSYSNVYHPLLNGRRPNADIFFKLMEVLGCAKSDSYHYYIRKEA